MKVLVFIVLSCFLVGNVYAEVIGESKSSGIFLKDTITINRSR